MKRLQWLLPFLSLAVVLVPLHGASAFGQDKLSRRVYTFEAGAADGAYDTRRFTLSPEVVADKDGSLRLAQSVLLADTLGATDYHQGETLSDQAQVKKIFVLDSADVKEAELFFFGSAKQVHVNGKVVSPPERLVSTGWSRVAIAPALLKKGENEVVFSGGGQLLFEPGRQPGRSFKSADGGKTWTKDNLGPKGDQEGEYLIRLRLGRFAARGAATSAVFDLWSVNETTVATPGKVLAFYSPGIVELQQPAGTHLRVSLRTGSTPAVDAKTWTPWQTLDKKQQPDVQQQAHRWAQLKFELVSEKAQATPRVPAKFALAIDFRPDLVTNPSKVKLTAVEPRLKDIAVSSVPFVYQAPSPRLQLLRERYQLDKVIAPGKTEMEQLMLLRYWVRNQWHTAWGSNAAAWMPPWDALIILESKDQPDCLTMCTHYAAVYTQCCLALGWSARHCILDHHCTAEVYVQSHNKWVMLDAGNSAERADVGLHFERKGVPLSALELHQAFHGKQTAGITVHFTPAKLAAQIQALCRPAPPTAKKYPPRPDTVPLAELKQYPVCQLENYRRYAFPPRNNFLSTLVPGELYQGWSEYFYDGYCWVGDSMDAPKNSPEYSRLLSPERPQDIDWHLNWSRIHLSATAKAGEVRVDVETFTPNLKRLEVQTGKADKQAWQPTAATFVWRLQAGVNVLEVRGVNQWDKAGRAARVKVEWQP